MKPQEDKTDVHAEIRDKKIIRRKRPADNRSSIRLIAKLAVKPKHEK